MFGALSIGWLGVQLSHQILPPLLPSIIADLSLTPFQAGIALSILWGLHAICIFPGGRFADGLSSKTVIVVGLISVLAGLSLLAGAVTYALFLTGIVFLGVGGGLFYIPMRITIAKLFETRRGEALGVNDAVGHGGNILAAGVAIAALAIAGWRVSFLVAILTVVFVLILIHRWGREPYVLRPVQFGFREATARVFQDNEMRWVLVAYSLFTFSWQGVVGFLPTFFEVSKGFSPTLAKIGFAVLFGVGIVILPFTTRVSDDRGQRPVAVFALGLSVIGLVVMLLGSQVWSVTVGLLLFATGLLTFPPVMQAYLMGLFADGTMGGDFGAIKTIYTTIGAVGSAYVGYVATNWSYSIAYGGIAAALATSGLILLIFTRPNPGTDTALGAESS